MSALDDILRLPVTRASADALDAADPLAALRREFALPAGIYFAGHSLGPAPLAAKQHLEQGWRDWSTLGVRGHHDAHTPWVTYAESLAPSLARLVGAAPEEVVAMNSLTVNLHLLLASFFRPQGARQCILIEAGAFSSDRHAIEGQLRWHGLDPTQHLIELAPYPGESCLRLDDVLAKIDEHRSRLALVLWPGVQFRTGQSFDCRAIARAAHQAGAMVGFDHAHAIGNLPLDLHGDDADFAVWCSYKYLNAGPGALAGAFVHERHHLDRARPRLAGWFGHELATRFEMQPGFKAAAGAAGWAVSNPPIFAAAPLAASLEIFSRAGLLALRAKSVRLTGWLDRCLRMLCGAHIEMATPATPSSRGAMLALELRGLPTIDPAALLARLEARGLAADLRGQRLRLTPAPLFNTYEECLRCAEWLRDELPEGR